MSHIAHVDIPVHAHVTHHVLGSETVAYAADALEACFLAHVLDQRLSDGLNVFHCVGFAAVLALEPGLQVEVRGSVQGDGIALEDIWDVGHVAVFCKLVGDQLDVDELVANDVRDEEDAGVFVGFA